MDFLPVPDELTASETLYALAHRNNMRTKVRTFSALLETLAELWLIELSGLDWNASLKEQSLKSAFWPKSVRLYEPATIAGLKARIKFLPNHPPLGMRPRACISEPIVTSVISTILLPLCGLSKSDNARIKPEFFKFGGAYLESSRNFLPY